MVPDGFVMDIDFNMTLQDAANAIPLLKKLEAFPCVGMIESPVPQVRVTRSVVYRLSNVKLGSAVKCK